MRERERERERQTYRDIAIYSLCCLTLPTRWASSQALWNSAWSCCCLCSWHVRWNSSISCCCSTLSQLCNINLHNNIHTYIHTCSTLSQLCNINLHNNIHTYIHTYIHTDVSVAKWLAWLTSNCRRIGAIGSSPSNSLIPNMWGQKGFNPLCQCVYIYVCIVKPDIQTIHRCSHTSIHTHTHTHTHTYIHTIYIYIYIYIYISQKIIIRGM